MIKLTCSLRHWLVENHPDIAVLIMYGHTELLTSKMWKAYIDWCRTTEGKRYLEGGDLYHA